MSTAAPPRCGPKFQTVVSTGIPIPGPVGPRGPAGIQGPPGPAGMNGAGLVVKGTVPTVGDPTVDLPQLGNRPGDGYIALDTGDIWTWSGTSWINGGKFGGPPGPQGIPGIQGDPGPVGPEGPTGYAAPATTTVLGAVIVGTGLDVQPDGTLSIATNAGSGLVLLPDGSIGVNAGPGLIVQPGGALTIQVGVGLAIQPDGTLTAAPASTTALGGVQIGSGLNVTAGGLLSVPVATATTAGIVIAGAGLNVQANGLLSVAAGVGLGISGSQLVLMPATTTSLGGIKIGSGLTVQADGTLSSTQFWVAGGGGAIFYALGNVGIGIVNPGYPLDVIGTIRTVIPANSYGLIVGSGTLLGVIGSTLGGLSFGTASADQLVLFTSGAPRITVASNGPVSIASTLTVASNTQITGGYFTVGPAAPGAQPGDLSVARNSAPSTGVIFFGNSGAQYIYFDGSTFNFQGGSIFTSGNATVAGGITSTGSISATGSGANISAAGSIQAGNNLGAATLQIANAIFATGSEVGIGGVWNDGQGSALTVNGNLHIVNGCLLFRDGTQQCTAGITAPPAGTMHNVTGARAVGNSYSNNNGVTMWVNVVFMNVPQATTVFAYVNGVLVASIGSAVGMGGYVSFPVPNGSSYQLQGDTGFYSWLEFY